MKPDPEEPDPIKEYDVKVKPGAEYFLLIKNRFDGQWKAIKAAHYREAQDKFNAAYDFPSISYEIICLAEKIDGQKNNLKVCRFDATSKGLKRP
jgi:hypothetical protein